MNNTFIFELAQKPISPQDRIERWELAHFFFFNNPFRTNEGVPFDVSDRHYALDCLKNELPQGYILDLVKESIDIIDPDAYLQETINRLQTINPSQPMIYPLGWWKNEVCLCGNILIYFDEELFTLHEFLLYAISISKDGGIQKFYVGGVFVHVY